MNFSNMITSIDTKMSLNNEYADSDSDFGNMIISVDTKMNLNYGYASSDSDIDENVPVETETIDAVTPRVKIKRRNRNGVYDYRYSNGNIRRISRYKNNKLHGRQTHYFLNGKCATLRTYNKGKRYGLQIGYYDNGRIQNIHNDRTVKNKYISYYDSGSIESIRTIIYKNGKKTRHIWMSFYDNKKLESYRDYKFKHDNEYMDYMRFWYDDKDNMYLVNDSKYMNDNLYGKCFKYHGNGVLSSYRNYRISGNESVQKGFSIKCDEDRTVKYLEYFGKNGYVCSNFFDYGDRMYCQITMHDCASSIYPDARTKVTIRKAQKAIRRRYTMKIHGLFVDVTNIIKPLVAMIIEYLFKSNSMFIIDHSIMHAGRIQ